MPDEETIQCYQCNHSGLLLPPDYVKKWGIKYGHGLGSVPVSECLNTNPRKFPNMSKWKPKAHPREFMQPMADSRATITLVTVPTVFYNDKKNRLVIARDDQDFSKRAAIVRKKQQENVSEWARFKAATGALDW